MDLGIRDLDGQGDTLALAEESLRLQRVAEAQILQCAARWCDQHPASDTRTSPLGGRSNLHPCQLGGEGTPLVEELSWAELAISLRISPLSCRALMAAALDLRHRFPALWRLTVEDLSVPAWVARKIATRTRHLSGEDAGLIDQALAEVAASLPVPRLFDKLEALIVLADSEAAEQRRQRNRRNRFVVFNSSDEAGLKGLYAKLDANDAIVGEAQVDRLARILATRADGVPQPMSAHRADALGLLIRDPEAAARLIGGSEAGPSRSTATTIVHLHLDEGSLAPGGEQAAGVGRLEGVGPVTLAQAIDLLRHTNVVIKPVLDPRAVAPADSYEFRGRLRDAVFATCPADVYPYARNTTHSMDIDHTVPYDAARDPGRTRLRNGGPMVRHHHRIKTHTGMRVRQPAPGVHVWGSPHQRYRVTDGAGTQDLAPAVGRALFGSSAGERAVAALLVTRGVRGP